MKIPEKSKEVFVYIQENGGEVSRPELMEALDRNGRSISTSLTYLKGKELIVVEKREVGEDEIVDYAILTDFGATFDADAETED